MRTLYMIPILLALLVGVGCAATTSQRSSENDARLVVRNESTVQMRIFVLSGGQRIRLGSAQAIGETRLRIPENTILLGRDLRFLALPMGSDRVVESWGIFVRPGQTVTLTIPSYIQ